MSIIESITNTLTGVDETSIYASDADSGRSGHLVFSPKGITFHPSFNKADFQEFPAEVIVDVMVEGDIKESQRFTFTRLFFLDKYALALPKRKSVETVMIGIVTSDGSRWGYVAKEGSSHQIYRQIERYLEYYSARLDSESGPLSMADELSELARLHQQGALDDEEFRLAKQQVIDRWGSEEGGR